MNNSNQQPVQVNVTHFNAGNCEIVIINGVDVLICYQGLAEYMSDQKQAHLKITTVEGQIVMTAPKSVLAGSQPTATFVLTALCDRVEQPKVAAKGAQPKSR